MLPLESVEYLKTRKYTAPHQGMHTAHAINCTHNCGRIKSTKWDNQWTSKSIKQLYLDQFFFSFWSSRRFSASCSLHRFSFLVHGTRCCCLSTLALILFLQQVFRDSARWFFIVSWAFCLSHHGGNYSKRDTKTPLRVIGFVCTGISTFAYRMNIFSRHKSSLTLR